MATLEPPGDASSASEDSVPGSVTAEEATERWWAPQGATAIEPAKVERPELCSEARAIENLLVSNFDGHNLTLPPLPQVPESVLKRLRDRNANLADVAKDIAEDQVIAAELVRMANSPLYGGMNKITAIHPAVTRLGTRAIRTLMMNQSFRSAAFHRKGADTDLASIIWYRSLAAGTIMRGLAAFTDVDAEDAFLIGLLHDIGNVIVLRIVDEQRALTDYSVDIDTFEYLCYESHQEFGELIADAWKLPASLKALVADHHAYPDADDDLRTERLLLALTDMISQMLGYGPPAEFDLLAARATCDLRLNENPRFESYLAQLPRELEESLLSCGGMGSHDATDRKDEAILARWLTSIRRGRTLDRNKLGRRRHPRWKSSLAEIELWLNGVLFPSPVRLLDLSEGGMRILFPERLVPGQRVTAAELGSPDGWKTACRVHARVINVSAQPDSDGLYQTGLEFSDSDGERLAASES